MKSLIRTLNSRPKVELLAWATVPFELAPLLQFFKSWHGGGIAHIEPLTFLAIAVIGFIWLLYGISIQSYPLIVGNTCKLFAATAVTTYYILS